MILSGPKLIIIRNGFWKFSLGVPRERSLNPAASEISRPKIFGNDRLIMIVNHREPQRDEQLTKQEERDSLFFLR